MLGVNLVLSIGVLKGSFQAHESYDLDFNSADDPYDTDNVNTLLASSDDLYDYAELRFTWTGLRHNGFLVGSFKKIKTNTKDGRRYRWILTD